MVRAIGFPIQEYGVKEHWVAPSRLSFYPSEVVQMRTRTLCNVRQLNHIHKNGDKIF